MTASRMSAFFWDNGQPSIFAKDRSFTAQGPDGTSLAQKATVRHLGLVDPRNQQRKGGITIAPRDVDSTAKSDRIRKAGI